jgi:hypothetical protein
MQELLNNDCLAIEIVIILLKIENLRSIIKIMLRIEQLWSIEIWHVKKSFVKIIYN